ncbi:MAG: TolC family protein, partial [Bacteroidales bacterium]|nr:TolC family protein [Bacteroidales bacterium]
MRKIQLYKTIIFLFLALLPIRLTAQLSAEDAVKKALENHYALRIAYTGVEKAKNSNTAGAAGFLPSLSANGTGTGRYDDNLQGEYSTLNALGGLAVQWRIWDGGAAWIMKDRLELLEQLSEGNAQLVVENTIQAVLLAYYRIRLEQERLRVVEHLLDLSRDRYEREINRNNLGVAVSFDVLQARNAYLSDSATLLMQELNVNNAFRNLNLLMDSPLEERPTLTDSLSPMLEGMYREDLIDGLERSNVSLRTQMLNLNLAAQNTRLQRSGLFPSVDLRTGTDYGHTRLKYAGDQARSGPGFDYYANFTLSFTLFNGGNIRRAIRDAQIDEQRTGLETSALSLGLK